MSDKVKLFTKNLEISEAIQQYIDKKTSKLDRHLKEIDEIQFDIAYSKTARVVNERYTAQITLRGRGFILRAEERSDDLYTAIDLVVDKIMRQIERYKGKRYRSLSTTKQVIEKIPETAFDGEDELGFPTVVKRKKFRITPMTEMEAVEQMNLVGHEDFYIFFNVKSNSLNVLYRRRDGNYGLIEPEFK